MLSRIRISRASQERERESVAEWCSSVGTLGIWKSGTDEMKFVTRASAVGLVIAGIFATIGGFPFDTPMPTHALGWVGPTCGLTRGSTAFVRGDLAVAWRYNPASFLVMGYGAFGVARAGLGHVTGRWINVRVGLSRLGWIVAAVLVIGLTLYQQSNAEFIINSRI